MFYKTEKKKEKKKLSTYKRKIFANIIPFPLDR